MYDDYYIETEAPRCEQSILFPISTPHSRLHTPFACPAPRTSHYKQLSAPDHIIGQPITWLAGKATNHQQSYANKFAYLQQYFDKHIHWKRTRSTTNEPTSSPYGEFFPTQAAGALLTMLN